MKFIILMVLFLGPLFSSGEGGDGDYVRREKRARERAEYDRKIRRELQERVNRLENQRSEFFQMAKESKHKLEDNIRRYYERAIEAKDKEAQIIGSRLEVCEQKVRSLQQDLDGTTRQLEKERGGAIGTTRQLGGLSGTFKKVGGGAIR